MASGRPSAMADLQRAAWGGSANAFASLALVLTIGLVAFSPLGASAAPVGIAASFAAVIAGGFVYALLGRVAVPCGGPSSATALILAGLVAQLVRDPALDVSTAGGLASLVAVTAATIVLMGALQMMFSLLGLGRFARFVPQPVLAGFMNAVALMILVAQVPPLLGLPALAAPGDATPLSSIQPLTLAVGLVTAISLWGMRWKWPRAPAPLAALAVGAAVYAVLGAVIPGSQLGPVVGTLPQGVALPDALFRFSDPQTLDLLRRHASAVGLTAVVLAVIGSLESLLAAAVIDQLTDTRHDGRRELMAIGLANTASGVFGGLPLVLSQTRAMTLMDGGSRGQGAVVAAAVVFAVLFAVGGPLIALIPRTVLAGVMLTIAVAMVDRWTRQLVRQLYAREFSSDLWLSLVLVAAVCAVTVAMGFVAGIVAGVLLSMAVFIRSMNRSLVRGRFSAAERPSRRVYGVAQEALLAHSRQRVTVLELEGALFFGTAERLAVEAGRIPPDCTCLVLDLQRVNIIDASGAVLLQDLSRRLARHGIPMLLAGVTTDSAHGRRLQAYGCFRESPRDDWFRDVDHAIEAAEQRLLAMAGPAESPSAEVALADSRLLQGLESAQVEQVLKLMPAQHLSAGALLFRQGDPGDRVYVLTQGSISIIGGNTAPRQRYVSFSPGVMLGEIAMLDGGGRSADAIADSDAVVHALSRADFESLCAADPTLGECLLRNIALHLAERLRGMASARQG